MKAKIKIWKISEKILAGIFVFVFSSYTYSQSSYQLDLSDTSTFDVTCGSVNSAQWTVKNDSCLLYTPTLETTGSSPTIYADYIIKINQSGNLLSSENAYIQHQVNGGAWVTDTMLIGSEQTEVFELHDSILLSQGSTVRFRIILETTSNSRFFAIKNGEIIINDVVIVEESSLPVELISFEAQQTPEDFIRFSWATATETNNDYFTLEKSFNGSFFEEISEIDGAGNSTSLINYTYYYEYKYGAGFYYRLKQTDFNGNYTYTETISVTLTDIKESSDFKITPNIITSNELSFTFSGNLSENNCLYIISQSGQIVYHIPLILDYSNNNNNCNKIILPNNLSTGIYYVELQDSYNKYVSKIVIK